MQAEVQLLSILPPGHEGLGGATGLTGQRGWGVSSQGQVGGAGGDGWRLWGESSDQETGCGTQAAAGGLVGLCPERKSRSRVYSYPLQPAPKEAGTGRQEKLPEWVFQWAPKAGVMGPLLTGVWHLPNYLSLNGASRAKFPSSLPEASAQLLHQGHQLD